MCPFSKQCLFSQVKYKLVDINGCTRQGFITNWNLNKRLEATSVYMLYMTAWAQEVQLGLNNGENWSLLKTFEGALRKTALWLLPGSYVSVMSTQNFILAFLSLLVSQSYRESAIRWHCLHSTLSTVSPTSPYPYPQKLWWLQLVF